MVLICGSGGLPGLPVNGGKTPCARGYGAGAREPLLCVVYCGLRTNDQSYRSYLRKFPDIHLNAAWVCQVAVPNDYDRFAIYPLYQDDRTSIAFIGSCQPILNPVALEIRLRKRIKGINKIR